MSAAIPGILAGFRGSERGSVAVMFGLIAIPVVLFIGLAIDYTRAVSVDRDLQEAVDAASMAAATYKMNKNNSSSTSTSSSTTIGQGDAKSAKQVALDYLRNNFKSGIVKNISGDAIEGESLLTVTASADVPTTFGRLVVDKFRVDARAAVRINGTSAPLCLLALNPVQDGAIQGKGTADLDAADCAVQSNSTHAEGLEIEGTAKMVASGFCSAGGHKGSGFSPEPMDNCPKLPDPFAGKYTGNALVAAGVNVKKACDQTSTIRLRDDIRYDVGPSGVYVFCAGLQINAGVTLTLGPGTFVFYNLLLVNGGATLQATEGTTIVFADKSWSSSNLQNGYLDIKGGGNFIVKAPKSGPLASMAILQPSVAGYSATSDSVVKHDVTGGGIVEMTGNWYTPQAETDINGNGVINADSPYFSMISDMVEIDGTGALRVKAGGDASSAGMTNPGGVTFGGSISLAE